MPLKRRLPQSVSRARISAVFRVRSRASLLAISSQCLVPLSLLLSADPPRGDGPDVVGIRGDPQLPSRNVMKVLPSDKMDLGGIDVRHPAHAVDAVGPKRHRDAFEETGATHCARNCSRVVPIFKRGS